MAETICFEAVRGPSTQVVSLRGPSTQVASLAGQSTQLAEVRGAGDIPCPGTGGIGFRWNLPTAGVFTSGPDVSYQLSSWDLPTGGSAVSGPPASIGLSDWSLPAGGVSTGGPLPSWSVGPWSTPTASVAVSGPPVLWLDPVDLMGLIDVTDPPPPFLPLNPNNTDASTNTARLNDMVANATRGLHFPKGEYAIDDTISTQKSAVPFWLGAGGSGQYIPFGSSNQAAMSVIMWHGLKAKNDRPMVLQRGECWNMHNMTFYGKPNTSAPVTDRAACAIQIGGLAGDPVNAGKTSSGHLTIEECDVGIQSGTTSTNVGGDNVTFGTVNFENCRIGFQMLNNQNLGWAFGFLRCRGIEQVCINILSGGRLTVHDGLMVSANVVYLRLNPGAGSGGIGSDNGLYTIQQVGQDGNPGILNCVWLDDHSAADGNTGSYRVHFDGVGFQQNGINYARIGANGTFTMSHCFFGQSLHERLFMDSDMGQFSKFCGVNNSFMNLARADQGNLFPGSGNYEVYQHATVGATSIRGEERITETTAQSGRAAWDALPIVSKYTGPGTLV